MKIIVVGVGKVGETLTRFISEEGHDVVIVDNDPMALQTVVDRYDVRGVVGNGASYEVLVEAGAQHSELLIATTDRDEVNILSCLVAKRHGVAYTIARVRNPEYSNQRSFYRDELGINLIVNPELETAREMIRLLTYPSASKIEPFADGRLDLVEVQVQEDSPLVGVALKELESKLNIQILVCAVERNGEAIIPDGNFVIQAEDIIHYTAIQEDLVKSFKRLKILKKPVKNVLIIGG
ncbi:MAG TPA: NAD-binding protein, partial [Haloplasmataceae bacterium]